MKRKIKRVGRPASSMYCSACVRKVSHIRCDWMRGWMSLLPQGEMENAHVRRCQQTQCSFFVNGGCQACDDCKAAPYEIRKSCSRCYGCENLPDELRWGKKNHNAQLQRNAPKEQLIEVKI